MTDTLKLQTGVEQQHNGTEFKEFEKELIDEKRLLTYISHLTILQRLGDRDLDNLFDGEVSLGEEELMAEYGLISIINGNNSFSKLKAPISMEFEQNLAPSIHYKIEYQKIGNKTYIKSISADKNYTPKDSKVVFLYDEKGTIKEISFERDFNFNQKIKIHRNTKGLADRLDVEITGDFDNKLTITYDENGKPLMIEQTKVGLAEDKTIFEHGENGELLSIIYMPGMSLKTLRKPTGVKGKGGAAILVGGARLFLNDIKRSKGVDTLEIENKNGIPMSTNAKLASSNWYYTDGNSKYFYDENGQLKRIKMEKEKFGIDDEKDIILSY